MLGSGGRPEGALGATLGWRKNCGVRARRFWGGTAGVLGWGEGGGHWCVGEEREREFGGVWGMKCSDMRETIRKGGRR